MRYQAQNSSADKEYEFDYVIIGSGSAGATLAYRLGEVAANSLAVIVFGGSDIGTFYDYEIQPGAEAVSDDALDDFIRAEAESAYHPCSTCKLGAETDQMAVVTPDCRVIDIENLYCADSSIFPRITNGNLNAPSIMAGEKAAAHIKGKGVLARANDTPFFSPPLGRQCSDN